MLTFVLSGLWHGANWTFLVWGALHGFYYLFGHWTKGLRRQMVSTVRLDKYPPLHHALKILTTFCLVCVAWIFFRANNLNQALYIVTHMWHNLDQSLNISKDMIGLDYPNFVLAWFLILLLIVVQVFQHYGGLRQRFSRWPIWVRWPVYVSVTLVIMNLGITENIPFVYFQF